MSKKVIIGSARHDENGGISGGKPGDQLQGKTPDYQGECSLQEWYKHELGWIVFRAKDPEDAKAIAKNMLAICNNPNVGYNQGRNQTLYYAAMKYDFDASKVKEPCETDCARSTRVSILYAGISCPDFYTATEPKVLEQTGAFDRFDDPKYTDSPDLLKAGDILVTRSKGHSVVVVDASEDEQAPHGYIKTTGSVYVRKSPRLDGKILLSSKAGYSYIYTGCYGIDQRGVMWYEVDTGLKDPDLGWISSAYARREV